MTRTAAATAFTDKLLQLIRQQRHLATRVVISTQEPTISPRLLDLCTVTIVHRFTSPEWFRTLRDHLAGVSTLDELGGVTKRDVRSIFVEIVELEPGRHYCLVLRLYWSRWRARRQGNWAWSG